MRTISLMQDWRLREEPLFCGPENAMLVQNSADGWMTIPSLPCDVHMALQAAGRIDDPLVGDNSLKCRWIEDRSWWFMKEFTLAPEDLENFGAELFIECLDIHADVFLNGSFIGHHASMFFPLRKNVRTWLRPGKNTLLIRLTTGTERVQETDIAAVRDHLSLDDRTRHTGRGDARRVALRKVQSIYGWDQAPRLPTCAIAGSVRLDLLDEIVVRDIRFETLELTGEGARIRAEAEIESRERAYARGCAATMTVEMDGETVYQKTVDTLFNIGLNYVDFSFVLPEPRLWWPNGYGEQPLYTVRVSAVNNYGRRDEKQIVTGIRTVRLEQPAVGQDERLYYFTVNGKKIYCKGMDFIQTDIIYARAKDELYDKLMIAARDAHFNMMRFWHGSVCYERDYAYELCDRYGILVHQGFAFECGAYPDHLPGFLSLVEKEAEWQIRRLRNHPCIALWCGNGECNGFLANYEKSRNWDHMDLDSCPGGADIFGQVLPRVEHMLSPTVPYQCTSPFGGYDALDDPRRGDRHPYPFVNIDPSYQQTRISFEVVDAMDARFITEGGVMSAPSKEALIAYCGGEEHARLDDPVFRMHCNSFERNAVRDAVYRHYTGEKELTLDEYCLYGGLFHGTLLSYEADHYRSLEHCNGCVMWCFTDGYGEVGFSVMDRFGNPKPAYYYMRRAFARDRILLRREGDSVSVYCSNDAAEPLDLRLTCGYVSFLGEYGPATEVSVRLEPFCKRVKAISLPLDGLDLARGAFYARPEGGDTLPAILRTADFRLLKLPRAARLTVSNAERHGDELRFDVTTDVFAHAVHFALGADRLFSDQYFDLLPGETRRVVLQNAQGVDVGQLRPASVFVC